MTDLLNNRVTSLNKHLAVRYHDKHYLSTADSVPGQSKHADNYLIYFDGGTSTKDSEMWAVNAFNTVK